MSGKNETKGSPKKEVKTTGGYSLRRQAVIVIVLVVVAVILQAYILNLSRDSTEEFATAVNHVDLLDRTIQKIGDVHEETLKQVNNMRNVLYRVLGNVIYQPSSYTIDPIIVHLELAELLFDGLDASLSDLERINMVPRNNTLSGKIVAEPLAYQSFKNSITNLTESDALGFVVNKSKIYLGQLTTYFDNLDLKRVELVGAEGSTTKISDFVIDVVTDMATKLNATNDVNEAKYYGEVISRYNNFLSSLVTVSNGFAEIFEIVSTYRIDSFQNVTSRWGLVRSTIESPIIDAYSSINSTANGVVLTAGDQANFTKLNELIEVNSTSLIKQFDSLETLFREFDEIRLSLTNIINNGLEQFIATHNLQYRDVITQLENESDELQLLLKDRLETTLTTTFITNLLLNVLTFGILLIIILSLIITVIRLTGRLDEAFTKLAQKDLDVKIFGTSGENEIGRIQKGFDTMVISMREILQKMAATSENLAQLAESMAASSEEASASINQVSDTMSSIAMGATQQTEAINRISDSLQVHLDEVQSVSERIADTSNFVKKVAKRTNILGLNASIEAAKAGHFGGGFNVVAENVRELSDDTKESANEISTLIDDIRYQINRTVQNVLRDVDTLKEITESTAAGTEEANASSYEQVSMLSEISEQASEVSRIASELNELLNEFHFN